MYFLVILVLCILSLTTSSSVNGTYKECPPNQEVCEYWLVVQEQLTMIHKIRKKVLVKGIDSYLYEYHEENMKKENRIPIEDVVTVDGVHRMVIAFNQSVPGPPIIVYEGQTLIIHVKNLLLSDSVTIHWHGIHQKETPWMDGVGWISQCPIASGQSFTYKFKAELKGTFWYHSHVGAQRSNGLFGALIVKEKLKNDIKIPKDMIMTVGDWHHSSAEEIYIRMEYGNFINGTAYKETKTLDGGKFSNVRFESGLIEGKGRYIDPITGIATMFTIDKNEYLKLGFH